MVYLYNGIHTSKFMNLTDINVNIKGSHRRMNIVWYHLYQTKHYIFTIVQHIELCSALCGSLDGKVVWGRLHTCIPYGWVPLLFTWNCHNIVNWLSDQIRSLAQPCPTLWDPMNRSMPGLPVYHQLPEFTQTHVHQVSDAIQPSHPLSSPSPPASN